MHPPDQLQTTRWRPIGSSAQLVAAVALCGTMLRAQTPMVPDRPEFTATSALVGTGFVEFDNGFTVGSEGGVHSFSGPETMVRLGLSKRLELRFDGDGFLAQWAAGADRKGHSDVEASAKIGLFGQGRFRPAVSLISSVS